MTEAHVWIDTMTIVGEQFLLAGCDTSHLVAEAEDTETGRPAVEPWRWDVVAEWQASYDRAELEATWLP